MKSFPRLLLTSTCMVLAHLPMIAADMGPIAIHGSLSATGAYSDSYNYMGDTAKKFDFIQEELTLNGAYRFENGLRVAAQIYAYDFDHYQSIGLDFANLDYSFNSAFGLRVGRNKLTTGLYGDIQDLDQVRTFASLPLNFYPRGQRALSVSYNGLAIYGDLKLGAAGSLDYQVFGGRVPSIDHNAPFAVGFGVAGDIHPRNVYGSALVWNAPIDGLRFGYSIFHLPKAGVPFPGFSADLAYTASVASIEYTKGKWITTSEYQHTEYKVTVFGHTAPATSGDQEYIQTTYQATDKIGLGAYFSYDKANNATITRDTAVAASYALAPWWLLKIEAHTLNGIGTLSTDGDVNPGAHDARWNYYMVKTTLSF